MTHRGSDSTFLRPWALVRESLRRLRLRCSRWPSLRRAIRDAAFNAMIFNAMMQHDPPIYRDRVHAVLLI